MYCIKKIETKYNTQKSKMNYSNKLYNLSMLHINGVKNIIFISRNIYDQAERYRVEHMIEVIEEMDSWNALSIEPQNIALIKPYLEYIDIIIFERTPYIPEYEDLLRQCKQHHIITIFDIDDLVFDKEYIDLIIQTTKLGNYDFWKKTTKDYVEMAKRCDGYMTTNKYLAQKINTLLKGTVWIMPNFYNKSQEKVSKKYVNEKNKKTYRDVFCMGYFSGTNSHFNDFMEIAEDIDRFMECYSNTVLKIVGYMDLPECLNKYVQCGRIIKREFMDCCSLQREIAEVDVNLIPLMNNEFTNCKSEIKYFEAAMVGTISCMPTTYVYNELNKKNALGYYCQEGQWFLALEDIYNDRDKMHRNFARLSDEAEQYYAYYNQIDRLENILNEMKGLSK